MSKNKQDLLNVIYCLLFGLAIVLIALMVMDSDAAKRENAILMNQIKASELQGWNVEGNPEL
jgi:hypothetical protein